MKSPSRLRCSCLLSFLLLPIIMIKTLSAAESHRAILPLTDGWRVQPATSPATPPKENDWGASRMIEYGAGWENRYPVQPGSASWNGIDRNTVHSIWLEKEFALPSSWRRDDSRLFLNFERLEGDAIIFINGKRHGELFAPGGELEVTNAITPGRTNRITVFNTRNYTGISRTFEQDALRHAARKDMPMKQWPLGITAPVELRLRPSTAITDIGISTSWRKKNIEIEVETDSAVAQENATIEIRVADKDGKEVFRLEKTAVRIPAGIHTHRVSREWSNPILWELEAPWLYQAQAALLVGANKKPVDRPPEVTFGFREIWTEGRAIFMNGHPVRWRMTDLYGASPAALSLYQLIGYNVGQLQPHSKLWWRDWRDTPLFDDELINEADRRGFALTLPAPGVSYLGRALLSNEALQKEYVQAVAAHVKKYRNHPSILGWAISMNSYNPQSNIHAPTMGKRETQPPEKGRVVAKGYEITKANDPTRLVFSHADGSIGDISTANVYLNFVPLQEREEWPMEWAKNGDMPYSAVEFGQPFTANFWKGKQFFPTEYFAIYFGEEAYRSETDAARRGLVEQGINFANFPQWGPWRGVGLAPGDWPMYWKFQDLFVNATNRSWRTWGVNAGWVHWLLDVGYGDPPGISNKGPIFKTRYAGLTEPLVEKPAWANPNFDIHKKANGPLLAWIAGDPVHTDKTRTWYAKETLTKSAAFVWDGLTEKNLLTRWALKDGTGVVVDGKLQATLSPGEIRQVPFSFKLPSAKIDEITALGRAVDMELSMTVTDGGVEVASDKFPLRIFPEQRPLPSVARNLIILDPEGKTKTWLEQLGVRNMAILKPGHKFKSEDVLLVGREALQKNSSLPWSKEDVAAGLRVIIFEQKPEVWEMLGFEAADVFARHTFKADAASPVFAGLADADLINWRGSPDLLPEGKRVRIPKTQQAPRWTNRHTVASVVLRIPEIAGFTPLLKTEFDLAYSPLLEWRHGRGAVYFSTLDFSGRVNADPAATLLAGNLLGSVLSSPSSPPAPRIFYEGDARGKALLNALRVESEPFTPNAGGRDALLIVGPQDNSPKRETLANFLRDGGTVLYLGKTDTALRAAGFSVETGEFWQVMDTQPALALPLFRGIGAELLRWRDPLRVPRITGPNRGASEGTSIHWQGALAGRSVGQGREIFLQLTPDALASRYQTDPDRREAIQTSVARLSRLVAQILTNLGAFTDAAAASRICALGRQNDFEAIGGWNVAGPWKGRNASPAARLDEVFACESDAIKGDANPNTEYRMGGGSLNWRKIADPDSSGFVDLDRLLRGGSDSVAYAQRTITLEAPKNMRIRLGVDYWMKFWVNGELQIEVKSPHGSPKSADFIFDIPLKKGANVFTLKVASGEKGFGFWADMNEAKGSHESGGPLVSYYQPLFKTFDPYQFHYW